MQSDKHTKGNSCSVLIVDDFVDTQKLFSYFLKDKATEIDVADNGKVAIAKINALWDSHRVEYDLVLMDMQMPEMDGIETTEHIRRIGREVPIVMVTASADDVQKKRAIQSGCNDYLAKPLSRRRLWELFDMWVINYGTLQNRKIHTAS